jgi:uncharacterized protein YndB with AHSA1/START domain
MTDTSDRELILSRTLNAPRELVWDAWTKPEHLIQWWGPKGFTNTFHEHNPTPGGVWRFIMHGPDGTDWPNRIIYDEVVKPERLTYTHDADTDDENDPQRFHVVVTFAENGDKTDLKMHMVMASKEALENVKKFGAVELGIQTVDKLEEHLAGMVNYQ